MSIEVELSQELSTRKKQHGDEVQSRFTAMCITSIDRKLLGLTYYKNDLSGKKFNKPTMGDGSPNPYWPIDANGKPEEPPRDALENEGFYLQIRRDTMYGWLQRLKSGEFDSISATSAPIDEPSIDQHEDVTNLDMDITEAPIEDGVEISSKEERSDPPEPSDVDKAMDDVCKQLPDVENKTLDKVDELVKDNATKGTPPPQRMATALKDVAGSPGTSLLRALDDYIASTDSPPEDKPDIQQAILKLGNIVAEQQKTMDKQSEAIKQLHGAIKGMAQKVPEMIKEEIIKKFS